MVERQSFCCVAVFFCRVSGHLAGVPGGPRPGFAVCSFHDRVDAQTKWYQVFSPVSLAKWASPQFESYV